MRILHVLSERGYSGGEDQLAHLLEHLAARGHESIVVLNPGALFAQTCQRLGLVVHEVRMRNDADLVAILRLRSLFKSTNPDLIHLACSRGHKLGALADVTSKRGPPKIVTRRMDYPIGASALRRWLYGSAVDAVVAISEGVRREVLAVGVAAQRVHCVHDGIDVGRFKGLRQGEQREQVRRELGVVDDTLIGLTTASLHRRKGQDVLLEALARLPDTGPRLLWLFAGDGPERSALEQRAAALGLLGTALSRRVEARFLGAVRPVDGLLAASDLFCLPSRREGLGVALLEAMAAGLAVVATAIGGMVEAVQDGVSGLLVPVEDVAALARALERLDDPELRARLGSAAEARAERDFGLERMCEQSEAIYLAVASERPSAAAARRRVQQGRPDGR